EIVGRDGRASRIKLEDPRPFDFTGDGNRRSEHGDEYLVPLGDAEILRPASSENEVVEVDPHGAVAPEDTDVTERPRGGDAAGKVDHVDDVGEAVQLDDARRSHFSVDHHGDLPDLAE